jgi:hypothetical protein
MRRKPLVLGAVRVERNPDPTAAHPRILAAAGKDVDLALSAGEQSAPRVAGHGAAVRVADPDLAQHPQQGWPDRT